MGNNTKVATYVLMNSLSASNLTKYITSNTQFKGRLIYPNSNFIDNNTEEAQNNSGLLSQKPRSVYRLKHSGSQHCNLLKEGICSLVLK
jgi:hypothetical protein